MNAGIFGPYKEHSEVLKEILRLKQQGYEESEMMLVADNEDRLLDEIKAKLSFETLDEEHDFFRKLKAAISLRSAKEEDLEEVQKLLDVSEEEAEVYYEQLKAGNIFIYIRPENMLIFDDVSSEDLLDENFEGTPTTRIHTKHL